MKTLICGLLAAVASATCSLAQAGAVYGTFSGTVYDAAGTRDGFAIGGLNGASLAGHFTYESSSLLSSWGTDGITFNAAYQYAPSVPVRIWASIATPAGSFEFDIAGDALSEVYSGRNFSPATYPNWLYIQASNIDTTSSFLNLYNPANVTFLANVMDSGSVNFSGADPASYGVTNFNSGALSFTVEQVEAIGESTGPVSGLPEPSTIFLTVSALAGLAWSFRSRNH